MNYKFGDLVLLRSSYFKVFWPESPELYDLYYCTAWRIEAIKTYSREERKNGSNHLLTYVIDNTEKDLRLRVFGGDIRLVGLAETNDLYRLALAREMRACVPAFRPGDLAIWDLRGIGLLTLSAPKAGNGFGYNWPATFEEAVRLCKQEFIVTAVSQDGCFLYVKDGLLNLHDVPAVVLKLKR